MAWAAINCETNGDSKGLSVFAGLGATTGRPNRVDIATVPTSFNATPDLTIAAGTRYVEVEFLSGSFMFVYVGPAAANDAAKQAQARKITSSRAYAVSPGWVVHVWTA